MLGVLHREFGAQVAIDPFHVRIFVSRCSLGYEIVYVIRPSFG